MQKKILFIKESEIKDMSVIDHNADPNVLNQVAANVQKLQLKPVLGATLYNSLVDAAYEKAVNGTEMSAVNNELLADYVKPFMVYATLTEYMVVGTYRATNAGVQKTSLTSTQNVQASELEYAKSYYNNYTAQYKQMLIDFLNEKGLLSQDADTDTTTPATGWFLEGNHNDFFPRTSPAGQTSVGEAETDPIWQAAKTDYYTKSDVDELLADIGANDPETDPVWFGDKGNYYTKAQVDDLLATVGQTPTLTVALNAGINTVISFNKTLYKSAFIDYVLYDVNGVNQRAGEIKMTCNGTQVSYYENLTVDIGSTDPIEARVEMGLNTFDVKFYFLPNADFSVRMVARSV